MKILVIKENILQISLLSNAGCGSLRETQHLNLKGFFT